ncbi:putative secreted protein with PEP-CTERM sorting signal [Roseimicrobium gellanilyticum]|uniref:Putative secreted protein with PEP-CTERM sorting signal n=1 Tax=Roseimicrobium gellanilyticum TaxID=748857 RepID=A0A366HVS0_9BACT|nr:PEP-CTERM sorting domain-containing protein [Roseimicrobium gellanilyticum]RBP48000.1 putative secreted protein with PEP-CTERM sorting signal [Roseimicrobium gellanilyticum]
MSRPSSLFLASIILAFSIPSAFAAEAGGTYSSNTTLVNGDTWTTAMTINNGATVNIPDLATVTYGAADNLNLSGTGTLRIDTGGTLFLDTKTGNDNIVVVGTVSVVNDGTVRFDAGTDIQLNTNGSSFTNNGLLLKTSGSDGPSNDPAYIYPSSQTVGGKFTNNGNITVQAGHLNISGSQSAGNAASSTGGIFTTTGTGVLSFSGGWTLLRGTSSMATGSSVELSNENPASSTGTFFVAMAPTTILDVDGDGLIWKTGKLNTNGNIIENQGLLRLQGVGATLFGTSGSFLNAAGATFRMESGDLAVTTVTLRNEGAMSLNGASPTTTITLSGTGLLENAAGGTFDLTSGTLTSSLAISNAGSMTNVAATLNTNGTFTNSGTFNQTGGVWNLTAAATSTSTGVLNLKGTTITITGTTLTNDGTATFIAQDGNVTLQGTGTFLNKGTFNHTYGGSNDNLVLGGTMTFQNEGTFDFQERGDLQITSSGKFVNNGLIQKTVAGTDTSFFYGTAGFTAGAGSQILAKAGILRMASGGTSDAAALWTADGGNLDLAGTWTGTIAGSSGNGGRVRITDSMNTTVLSELTVGTGGLTLDIKGDGLFWNQKDILTAGNTLTNVGIFTITDGGIKNLTGGGQLLNGTGGILHHLSGTVTLVNDTIIRNQGAMNITAGTGTAGYGGEGAIVNDAGGTITHTSGSLGLSGNTKLQNDGTYQWTAGTINLNTGAEWENNGLFNINGGSTITHTFLTDGTGTFTNGTTGVMDWTGNSAFNLGTGVTLTNDGNFNVTGSGDRNLSGAGTFINNGTFNHLVTVTADNLVGLTAGGSFVNNGDFNFVGVQDFRLGNGYTFTNTGTLTKTTTSNSTDQAQFFAFLADGTGGTFDNQGTVRVEGGHFRITAAVSGSTQFIDVNLVQKGANGTLTGGTWVADSTATTLVSFARIDLAPFGASSGINTIGENAVVDLIGSGAELTQLSSLTSVAGEFYVSNGKNFNATHPSNALNVTSTGTVGGDGTFSDAITVDGAVTPGSGRGTQNGKLTFASGVTFNAGSSITLQLTLPTGTVPLDGSVTTTSISSYIAGLADLDPTTEHDAIDANGTLTLNPDMTISVVSNGTSFTFGQYFDLFDWTTALAGITTQAEVDAILELPTLDAGSEWKTDLFLSHGIVYVVPEPSRALLLLGGMMVLGVRRRRKLTV